MEMLAEKMRDGIVGMSIYFDVINLRISQSIVGRNYNNFLL